MFSRICVAATALATLTNALQKVSDPALLKTLLEGKGEKSTYKVVNYASSQNADFTKIFELSSALYDAAKESADESFETIEWFQAELDTPDTTWVEPKSGIPMFDPEMLVYGHWFMKEWELKDQAKLLTGHAKGDSEKLYKTIADLAKTHVDVVRDCSALQERIQADKDAVKDGKPFNPTFVLWAKNEISEDTQNEIRQLSEMDSYTFYHEPINYVLFSGAADQDSPACHRQVLSTPVDDEADSKFFDQVRASLIFHNEAKDLQINKDTKIAELVSQTYVKSRFTWGKRARTCLFDPEAAHRYSAVVLFLDEKTFEGGHVIDSVLSAQFNIFDKLQDTNIFSLIAPYYQENLVDVNQLRTISNISRDKLPVLIHLDTKSRKMTQYNESLDEDKISPEIIAFWARSIKAESEKDFVVKKLEKAEGDETLTAELAEATTKSDVLYEALQNAIKVRAEAVAAEKAAQAEEDARVEREAHSEL